MVFALRAISFSLLFLPITRALHAYIHVCMYALYYYDNIYLHPTRSYIALNKGRKNVFCRTVGVREGGGGTNGWNTING